MCCSAAQGSGLPEVEVLSEAEAGVIKADWWFDGKLIWSTGNVEIRVRNPTPLHLFQVSTDRNLSHGDVVGRR